MYSDENRSDREEVYDAFFDYYMAYNEVQRSIDIVKRFDEAGKIK